MFDFDEQLQRFTKNLAEARASGDKMKEGDALEGLAICYSAIRGHEDPQKAIGYYGQAIEIFLQIPWWEMYYKANGALGMVYENLLNAPEIAIKVYELALDVGTKELVLDTEKHYRDRIVRSLEFLKSRPLSKP